MAKWKIDFIMRSGNKIAGIYEGPEENVKDVTDIVICGNPNQFIGIRALYEKANLLVKKGEIAAATISVYEEI